jgi:hypothetical protein
MRPGKTHLWIIGGAEKHNQQTWKEILELNSDLSE